MTDKTQRISAAEYRKLMGLDEVNAVPKPRNKYGARKTVVDGVHFPSKLEAAVWCAILKHPNGFTCVKRYPSVRLPGNVTWKIDFESFEWDLVLSKETGVDVWRSCYHEAKGVETADYKVKLKLYREFGDRPLHIWKGSAKKPFISETVIPKNMGEK